MTNPPKLTRVTRFDAIPLQKAHWTDEGYLVDNPIVTSCGIFDYTNPDGSTRRELRLPEHVFAKQSLASYKGKPVILTHDAGRVTKNNVAEYIIGTVLTEGKPDGNDVRAEIVIHDTDELKLSRLKELSLGYDQLLDETPGEWHGERYDAIQTDIVINHLAIVREARAGEQARLNIDGKDKIMPKNKKGASGMKKKKVMNADELKKTIGDYKARRQKRLDEAEAAKADGDDESEFKESEMENEDGEMAEEIDKKGDAPTIEDKVKLIKDRRDRRDAEGDPDEKDGAMGLVARQDEDIEELLEIIEQLQAQKDFAESADSDDDGGKKPVKTDAKDAVIRKEIDERVKLGLLGRELKLDGLETKKPLDAKKAVIKRLRPHLNLDGKGAGYIDLVYEMALEDRHKPKDTDYQRRQAFNGDSRAIETIGKPKSQQAREKMLERVKNGGKN